MGQPDLNAAIVLVHVAQVGSFRAAADALGMPKTSVSRKVADLEARLGVQLLRRTTRHVALTDAGQAYVEAAQGAIANLEAAEHAISQQQREPHGRVRVTAPAPLGQGILTALISEFLLKYPKVEVQLHLTYRPVDLLTERFDVALRYGALPESSLTAILISGNEHRLVASPAYLATHGTPEVPANLSEHNCLLFGVDNTVMRAKWALRSEKRTVDVSVRGRFVADDLIAVREAALRGLGIAHLPEQAVAKAVQSGELVAVLREYTTAVTPLYLLHSGGTFLTLRTRALVDFLNERLSSARAKR